MDDQLGRDGEEAEDGGVQDGAAIEKNVVNDETEVSTREFASDFGEVASDVLPLIGLDGHLRFAPLSFGVRGDIADGQGDSFERASLARLELERFE